MPDRHDLYKIPQNDEIRNAYKETLWFLIATFGEKSLLQRFRIRWNAHLLFNVRNCV